MSNRTILIADDDAGMIRLLRTILEPLAVRVRETYDATGASHDHSAITAKSCHF